MNYGNAYYSPYNTPNYPSMAQQVQVVKVNGEGGARAYQMSANSSALLLDESGQIVWLKITDGAGFPTITPYDITPHRVSPSPDFSTLETRIAKLEEIVNASTDTATIKRKKSIGADASAD